MISTILHSMILICHYFMPYNRTPSLSNLPYATTVMFHSLVTIIFSRSRTKYKARSIVPQYVSSRITTLLICNSINIQYLGQILGSGSERCAVINKYIL